MVRMYTGKFELGSKSHCTSSVHLSFSVRHLLHYVTCALSHIYINTVKPNKSEKI